MNNWKKRETCVVCEGEFESTRALDHHGRIVKPPQNVKKLLGKGERVCSIFCSNVMWNQYCNSDEYVFVKRKHQL